jgi:hypothetical protein
MVKSENGWKTGDLVKTIIFDSPKFDLGKTNQSDAYFYVANMSGYFVNLELLQIASARPLASSRPIDIKLVPGDFTEMYAGLWPMDSRLPKVAPPLTPTPPSTQEKK